MIAFDPLLARIVALLFLSCIAVFAVFAWLNLRSDSIGDKRKTFPRKGARPVAPPHRPRVPR